VESQLGIVEIVTQAQHIANDAERVLNNLNINVDASYETQLHIASCVRDIRAVLSRVTNQIDMQRRTMVDQINLTRDALDSIHKQLIITIRDLHHQPIHELLDVYEDIEVIVNTAINRLVTLKAHI
jgi:hypothetical protein